MAQNRVYSMIGIAQKAGKLASGEFATEHAVKSGRAALVIVSDAASENTKKKFRNMCVSFTKYRCTSTVERKSLGTPWERNSGHLLQYWTKVLRRKL